MFVVVWRGVRGREVSNCEGLGKENLRGISEVGILFRSEGGYTVSTGTIHE